MNAPYPTECLTIISSDLTLKKLIAWVSATDGVLIISVLAHDNEITRKQINV